MFFINFRWSELDPIFRIQILSCPITIMHFFIVPNIGFTQLNTVIFFNDLFRDLKYRNKRQLVFPFFNCNSNYGIFFYGKFSVFYWKFNSANFYFIKITSMKYKLVVARFQIERNCFFSFTHRLQLVCCIGFVHPVIECT